MMRFFMILSALSIFSLNAYSASFECQKEGAKIPKIKVVPVNEGTGLAGVVLRVNYLDPHVADYAPDQKMRDDAFISQTRFSSYAESLACIGGFAGSKSTINNVLRFEYSTKDDNFIEVQIQREFNGNLSFLMETFAESDCSPNAKELIENTLVLPFAEKTSSYDVEKCWTRE